MKVRAHDAPGALGHLLRQKRYAPIRDRLRAVGWAHQGKSAGWIGEQLGYHHVTVRRWVARYNGRAV